jgi:hypothetical protein
MANYVRAESLGTYYDPARRDEITPTRKKWLHKKMKEAELYGRPDLPFQIGKKRQLKAKPLDRWIACDGCGNEMAVSKITYIIICSRCGNLCKVESETDE